MDTTEKAVFDELATLSVEYADAMTQVEFVQKKMTECFEKLGMRENTQAWSDDEGLLFRLIAALPACTPRFELLERLHALQSPDGVAPHGFPDIGSISL